MENKFNAWHKEQKKMYTAEELGKDQLTLMPDGRGFVNVHSKSTSLSQIDDGRTLIPLQYIGKEDKHGKEIHNGDIVRCEGVGGFFNDTIIWEGCGFKLKGATALHSQLEDYKNIEIIGNIYEGVK